MGERLDYTTETSIGGGYFDRYPRDSQEKALRAVMEEFGITVGSATVYQLDDQQLAVLARALRGNPAITSATQKTEKGADGFTYSFIEAFVDNRDDKIAAEELPVQNPENQKGVDLTTEQGIVDHMSASTSESDWNNRADEVRASNGGNYPQIWYPKVILSGLSGRVSSKW